MKKLFSLKGIISLAVVMAVLVMLPSCDDDDILTPPQVVNISGEYSGKMCFSQSGSTEADTTDVDATAANDTVYFKKFPVKTLIASIVGEENAEKIATALGDVKYGVGYKTEATTKTDSISLVFDPKPLELIFPTSETQTDTVVVEISTLDKGLFASESENLKFGLKAENVSLNGNDLGELFKPIDFKFDLTK